MLISGVDVNYMIKIQDNNIKIIMLNFSNYFMPNDCSVFSLKYENSVTIIITIITIPQDFYPNNLNPKGSFIPCVKLIINIWR